VSNQQNEQLTIVQSAKTFRLPLQYSILLNTIMKWCCNSENNLFRTSKKILL